MKILVIDYPSYRNHQRFNKLHIDTLVSMGHSLCLVGRKGQFENCLNIVDDIISIPEKYYKEYPCEPISIRLSSIGALFWIRRNIDLSKYDMILFLTYDIMSLWTFRTSKLTLLINHNNVGQLDSKIKLVLTKSLPENYHHITLNPEMTTRMRELESRHQVTYIPHGLIEAIDSDNALINKEKKYFVCPVNRNFDYDLCETIFNSKKLYEYLDEKNLTLYIKQHLPYSGLCDNIEILDSDVQYDKYIYLLRGATGVILPYGVDFKYRCSGIFFECVLYDVPIIARDISAFRYYKKGNNICLFDDVDTLIKSMSDCMEGKITPFDKTSLMPSNYWAKLFESL